MWRDGTLGTAVAPGRRPRAPQNIEKRAAIGSCNPRLETDPRELRAGSGTGAWTPTFRAASFTRGERRMEDTVLSGAAGPQVSESTVTTLFM